MPGTSECAGSARRSVHGPLWPKPVVPAVVCHCSASVWTERPKCSDAGRCRSGARSEVHGLSIRGRGPVSRPSAGGQATCRRVHRARVPSPRKRHSGSRARCRCSRARARCGCSTPCGALASGPSSPARGATAPRARREAPRIRAHRGKRKTSPAHNRPGAGVPGGTAPPGRESPAACRQCSNGPRTHAIRSARACANSTNFRSSLVSSGCTSS